MAAATREMRYRNLDVVGGSSAYELDWEDRERELRHAGEARRFREETRRQQKELAKVHAAPRVLVREAQHVPVMAVLGVTAVLLMALMLLGSYINLTMISADTVKLQKQMAELETEHVALTAEYQQMFDLTTVKDVARAAGMDKPGQSQVCYIDLTGGDNAVVYRSEEPSVLTRILASLHHGVYTVLEYFE